MDYVIIGIGFTAIGFVFGFTSGTLFALERIQTKTKDKTKDKTNEKNNK